MNSKRKIKQQLYKNLNYKQPYENSINTPLISTNSELIEILNTIENITKFFYKDNKALFNILYQEEKIIQIVKKRYEYSFLYYLSLLIKDNEETVNFKFGIDFIKGIENENNNQKNELKKLLVSRIILDLYFNYEGIKEDEDEDEELNKIFNNNKMYFTKHINIFKKYDLNLEKIEEKSLEIIYLDIIIELIKNKKLENYDSAHDLLIKLDLENIDINQNMLGELKKFLDDEKYINDYKLNEIEDFFVEIKVNFYYLLIKYILKKSFFIYNIPLLYNSRKYILKIIKTKREKFLLDFNKGNFDLFKRIYYNIKFILDSNYYLNIFIGLIIDNILEEAIKNENGNLEEYINYLSTMEKNNDKIAFINSLYDTRKKDMDKTPIKFEEIAKIYINLERLTQNKKFEELRREDKLLLSKYYIDNNNKNLLLKLFGQDSYDFFLKESIKFDEKEKNEKRNKLKKILEYYKTFCFDSRKKDISSIEYEISEQGNLNYKINEHDFEKAKKLNDIIPLINYLYKIKDGNKTESEIQDIIEKYNSLEKMIIERELLEDINIENETITQLFDYFNDKNNEKYLIGIFCKENYEYFLHNYNKNTEKNEIIKFDELYKNNTKENYSRIKYQYNTESEDSNLLSITTKFHTMDSKSIINNSEQKIICYEEKLAISILSKSKVILNAKSKGGKLSFIFESINYGDYNISINNDKLLQIKEYFIKNKNESIIAKTYFKYMEFLDEFKNRICTKYIQDYKLKIILEFQINDKIENDSIFIISCCYKFYSDVESNKILKEGNILLNKVNSLEQDFQFLINDKYFEGVKTQYSSEKEANKASYSNNRNDNKSNHNNKDNFNNKHNPNASSNSCDETKNLINDTRTKIEAGFDLQMEAQNYQIVKIIGIMGEHMEAAEFIKELSNGCYISGGRFNNLKIYNKDFIELKEETDLKDKKNEKDEIDNKHMVYTCFERERLSDMNDHDIELIANRDKIIFQIFLSFKDSNEKIMKIGQKCKFPDISIKYCVQLERNNFAIFEQNNSLYCMDLFNSENKNSELKPFKKLKGKTYINSIKINKNIIAITSNKVQDNGEDELIFYDIEYNKIYRKIEGYSFASEPNGLALMFKEETKAKILLCACTKYINDQKNGIYLVNLQMEDKQGINNPFYDTGNFEVFCFCPILIINPDNDIEEKGKKKKIIDTEYFFVGGFNNDKSEGEIKLFKVIYNEKVRDYKIEFVQDIEFERNKDFSGFEGAVSCIIQTKKEKNGYILVTCYSGKVYLLTKPNLNHYLKTKNKSSKGIKKKK